MGDIVVERELEKELEKRAALVSGAIEKYLPLVHPCGLYEAGRHLLDSGGKRLRPSMLLLAAEAAGGISLSSMMILWIMPTSAVVVPRYTSGGECPGPSSPVILFTPRPFKFWE